MKNEILYRGFESIPSRQGRGGVYQYVRWQDVADRMNEAFGILWSSSVVFQDVIGNNVIVRVRVSVIDPETKVVSSQDGFGGAPNDDRSEAGNPFKAAYSKALKDACKKWGLGLFLELEEDGEGGHALPQGYHGKEQGIPNGNKVMPSSPMERPTSTQTGGLPMPPGASMPSAPDKMVQETIKVQQSKPVEQTQAVPPTPPAAPQTGGLPTPPGVSLKDDMPMSKVGTINTGEDLVSDVQKAAIKGILAMPTVPIDYEELAKQAFEFNGVVKKPIPSIDELTYQEAVYVVKYGNDQFRKR
jgi:hypothetical protein